MAAELEANQVTARVFYAALSALWDISQAKALDAFARAGTNSAAVFAPMCRETHAWEFNGEHAETLAAIPRVATVRIGCTYNMAGDSEHTYDLISADAPQGIHTDKTGRLCFEHFRFMRVVGPLLNNKAIVCFYVNLAPYDMSKIGHHGDDTYDTFNYEAWMKERRAFYGVEDATSVTLETALAAYRSHWLRLGFEVKEVVAIPHLPDVPGYPQHAYRIAFKLERTP